MLLSLSYYKIACHYFLHLQCTLCTHTYHIFCLLLLCSAAQKMKSSSRRAGPRSSAYGMVPFLLLRPLGLVISFLIRFDVINTGYNVYFTIYHFICET
jgi:hypothetical protein